MCNQRYTSNHEEGLHAHQRSVVNTLLRQHSHEEDALARFPVYLVCLTYNTTVCMAPTALSLSWARNDQKCHHHIQNFPTTETPTGRA